MGKGLCFLPKNGEKRELSKIRISDELKEKAKKAFHGKEAIRTGEGLSRKELRILERAGIVEKIPAVKNRKYIDTTGSLFFIWKLR